MWNFMNDYPILSNSKFESQYNCSSTAMAGKDVDEGDKIFLPPSALDRLARMNVEYPMLFEITNNRIGKKTHCGVLEFSAEEGWCYMPFWMMQNLVIEEGSLVTIKNISLSKATFVKFRAQSCDFLEVSNPRALLEVALRKFTCLTVGDTICIPHVGGNKFYLDVREVQPNNAASIIETDCNVDFEEPLGYQDSKYAQYEREHKSKNNSRTSSFDQTLSTQIQTNSTIVRTLQKARAEPTDAEIMAANSFKAFSGNAKRIDGKIPVSTQQAKQNAPNVIDNNNSNKSHTIAESKQSNSIPDVQQASSQNVATPIIPTYQSKIGDKYSKKKVAVSAFTGTAYKLT